MPSYSGVFTLQAQMQAIAAGLWTAPPGAPTIGTATGGNASASVTFTAPAYTGNPAGITSYTVTSSPGGITGTGASSPVTVSGLSNGTAYTFTVTATGASGTGSASAASNSVTPVALPAIGAAYGGGYFAGQIGVSGVATHNLVIGPLSTAQNTTEWKNATTATPGADSVIDGVQNTADMVADGNATVYPAAHFCNNLSTGGQTDWYMPAKNELEVCYFNLKPTTTANQTSSGINPNAIPPRASNYTSGNPAQTSATDFRDTGTEDFAVSRYWNSTEYSASRGTTQDFGNGYQKFSDKYNTYTVRAIRRVAA